MIHSNVRVLQLALIVGLELTATGARGEPGGAARAAMLTPSARWEVAGTALTKVVEGGHKPPSVDLRTFGINSAELLVANPYDKGVWIFSRSKLIALDGNGRIRAKQDFGWVPESARIATDESLWARKGDALFLVGRNGAVSRSISLPAAGALISDWDIDALSANAWMATATSLKRVSLANGSTRSFDVEKGLLGLALDPILVEPWVLYGEKLVRYDANGQKLQTFALAKYGIANPTWISFLPEYGAIAVGQNESTTWIARNGQLIAKVASDGTSLLPVPLTTRPSLAFVASPKSTASDVEVRVTTACMNKECSLGNDWLEGFALTARLGRLDVSHLIKYYPAKGLAIVALPGNVPAGLYPLLVEAQDRFGHRANPISINVRSASPAKAISKAGATAASAKATPQFCVSSPNVDTSGSFLPFAALERLEIRSGRAGAADWEWGLGTNTQQAGKFVSANLDWISGRTYSWDLSYDGQGGASVAVRDGASLLFKKTFAPTATDLMRAGNALSFYAKSSSGIGAGNKTTLGVTQINGVAVTSTLTTSGDGSFSEAAVVYALNSAIGFSASGTVRMDFVGSYPPTGSRLNMTVTTGNVTCPVLTNKPPTVMFVNWPSEQTMFAPGFVSGGWVNATDDDGEIAGLIVSVPGPNGFLLNAGPVTDAFFDWNDIPIGDYTITAQATDNAGAVTTAQAVVHVAMDPVDQPYITVWNAIVSSLAAGNVDLALQQFSPGARDKFSRVFQDLGSESVTSLTTLTPLRRVELTDTYAQYVVKRTANGDDSVFIVTFMRDENGAWQVEDM